MINIIGLSSASLFSNLNALLNIEKENSLTIFEKVLPNIESEDVFCIDKQTQEDVFPKEIRKMLLDDTDSFIVECLENGIRVDFDIPYSLSAQKEKFSSIQGKFSGFVDECNTRSLLPIKKSFSYSNTEKKYKNIIISPLEKYDISFLTSINSLIKNCESLTILINSDTNSGAIKTIGEYFIKNGFVPNIKAIKKDLSLKNIVYGINKEKIENKNIKLYEASSMYDEINNILNVIRANKILCGDVAIVSENIDEYLPVIFTIFKDFPFNIVHSKEPFSSSFIFKSLLYLYRYLLNPKDIESVVNLIKLDYLGFPPFYKNTIDIFFERFGNNYDVALKNGKKFNAADYAVVESSISELEEKTKSIRTDIGKSKTFFDLINATINFLETIKYTDTLSDKTENIDKMSQKRISCEWDCFCELLKDINNVYGEDKTTFENFVDVFQKVSRKAIIPNAITDEEEIEVSDIKSFFSLNKKYVFMVGCFQGDTFEFDSLINSLERKRLNAHLSTHFKTDESEKRNIIQKIYSIISVDRQLTYISTSKTNTSGIELYPSGYFKNLFNCLPASIEVAEKDIENVTQLLFEIADENYTQKENDDAYFAFLDLIENKKYSKRISDALRFMYRDKSKFDIQDPGSIFKERDYFSATMLESYNKCPFKNYVDYGIKPQKLNIFEESPADIGDYYHTAIAMFFNKIEKENIFFNTIEEFDVPILCEDIFEIVDDSHNDMFLDATSRNKFLKEQMQNKIICSIWNIICQLKKGKFSVFKNEYNLSVNNNSLPLVLENGETVYLTGIIDRLDTCDNVFKVVDYKSSAQSFSEELVKTGIQLQLPLYAVAINKDIAGFYYFHIQNPVLDLDKKENSALKKFKLNGMTNEKYLPFIDDIGDGESSEIISAKKLKNGKISSASQVFSDEDFNNIMNLAKESAKKTIEDIKNGIVFAKPNKEINPCKYCEYNKICQFN